MLSEPQISAADETKKTVNMEEFQIKINLTLCLRDFQIESNAITQCDMLLVELVFSLENNIDNDVFRSIFCLQCPE